MRALPSESRDSVSPALVKAGGIGPAQQRIKRGCDQAALRLDAAQQQVAAVAIGLLEGDVENDGDRHEGDDKKPELAG